MQRLLLLMLLGGAGVAPQLSTPAQAQQQASVAAGHYVWGGGETERAALDRAIDAATESMSIFTRGIARDRLRERLPIPAAHQIWLDEREIAIESGSGKITAPRDGRPIFWKNARGERLKVVHRVVDGKVHQHFSSDGGSRTNVFSMDGDRLVVEVTVSAPRLPEDVRFQLTYKRPS